jgi:hypothetical protein
MTKRAHTTAQPQIERALRRTGIVRLWTIALASIQIALVCATSCLPALHRAWATHDHVFCSEHRVFEDVARRAPADRPDVSAGHDDWERNGARDDGSHVVCAFSNLSFSTLEPVRAGTSTFCVMAEAPIGILSSSSFPPVAALVLAPKNSPPALG